MHAHVGMMLALPRRKANSRIQSVKGEELATAEIEAGRETEAAIARHASRLARL
jgi:hypothetical protein